MKGLTIFVSTVVMSALASAEELRCDDPGVINTVFEISRNPVEVMTHAFDMVEESSDQLSKDCSFTSGLKLDAEEKRITPAFGVTNARGFILRLRLNFMSMGVQLEDNNIAYVRLRYNLKKTLDGDNIYVTVTGCTFLGTRHSCLN